MNRITVTINLTDDVQMDPKDIHQLLDLIKEDIQKFEVHSKCISGLTAFYETKKHYHH